MTIGDCQNGLERVERAIASIEEGAQEYKIGSRSVRRGELSVLYAERRRLESLLASAQGGTTLAAVLRR